MVTPVLFFDLNAREEAWGIPLTPPPRGKMSPDVQPEGVAKNHLQKLTSGA
jgi:hypothetical protein